MQNEQTEQKQRVSLFLEPEGVQRYVEWRSLFIAFMRSALFLHPLNCNELLTSLCNRC